MKPALIALTLVLIVGVAASVPVQSYKDFQVLFHANMGLLRGIPLYDHAGQVAMIAQLADVPSGQVYVLPFPYPPWYALSTLWLARFPVYVAARVWFGLNLLMLLASIGILTWGMPIRKQAPILVAAIFWLPALGSLFVGQYGFPVLLGAALMAHGLKRERPILVAMAAALLTFKPHLGLAIVILAMLYILKRRDRFARDTSVGLLAAGVLLFGLGFLASPSWPTAYAASLISFESVHGVPECTQCVSLPVLLARLFGGGLNTAAWIALVLGILACASLAWRWRELTADPFKLVSIGALVTLVVSPYLLNYDYLILLVPFAALTGGASSAGERIAMGIAYISPPAALMLWGPAGNAALIASTGIVLALLLRRRIVIRTPELVETA